jgi:hypothetical protein
MRAFVLGKAGWKAGCSQDWLPHNQCRLFGLAKTKWRGHSCLPRPDSSGRLPGALKSTSRRVGTPQTESPRHVVAEKSFLRGTQGYFIVIGLY